MSRAKPTSHRKLMEWQSPEDGFGPILAILATTYELDATFVETDLLPTLLGLGAWDDRSWASRVALERSLAGLEATTLLLDQRCYRGRPRSLHIEVLPSVGASGQVLHAKVLLVVHEAAVRLQVASANLTEAGYRENREVALPLVASSEAPAVARMLLDAIESMPVLLAPWWTETAQLVHRLAKEKLQAWAGAAAPEDAMIVWGGGPVPVWRQVLSLWPPGEQVERISIVSPFWSEEGVGGPFGTLTGELRRKNVLVPRTPVDLYTEAEDSAYGTFRPKLPPLGPLDPQALGIKLTARAVLPLPSDEPGMDDVLKRRRLHAKVLVLHGSRTTVAYVGSANFTVPGWGFMADATRANIEAGVVLRRGPAFAAALLPPTTGASLDLDASTLAGVPPSKEEPSAPVPTFIKAVRLEPDPSDADRLHLLICVDATRVHGPFQISSAGLERRVLLRGDLGCAEINALPLTTDDVNQILREQQVRVAWWETVETSEFPVNVDLAARFQLPVVPGCPNPGEQLLLAYYQGRINITDLYPPPAGWEDDAHDPVAAPLHESTVDTSRIQSYQVRAFVEALQGIRDDLAAAALGSDPAMRLALRGPVSPLGLARHVLDAARAGKRSSTAAAFQLVEIAVCLKQAEGVDGAGAAWAGFVAQAQSEIEAMLDQLAGASTEIGPKTSFGKYANAVLGWRPKGGTE